MNRHTLITTPESPEVEEAETPKGSTTKTMKRGGRRQGSGVVPKRQPDTGPASKSQLSQVASSVFVPGAHKS